MKLAATLSVLALALPAQAATPGQLSLRGRLTDAAGALVNDVLVATFRLYDVAEGGEALWTEPHDAIGVTEGRFEALLGAAVPIDPAWLGGPVWLGVSLPDPAGVEQELSPRALLGTAPYALRAGLADTADEVADMEDLASGVAVAVLGDAALLLQARGALGEAGADGAQGAAGADCFPEGGAAADCVGLQGAQGPAGANGAAGADCFAGLGDANEDGQMDAADCIGPPGPPGASEVDPGVLTAVETTATLIGDLRVDDLISGANASFDTLALDGVEVVGTVAALRERVWCLEQCHAEWPDDCTVRTCQGVGQCTLEQRLDATPCGGGVGRCTAGECILPPTCGDLGGRPCGEHPDGFGGTLWCGGCDAATVCSAEGQCVPGCGGIECPAHPLGWPMRCNGRAHCAYAPEDDGLAAEIWVPPGTFSMGSPPGEPGREDLEDPPHDVTFAAGFFIAKYEVTAARHEACEASGACGVLVDVGADPLGWGLNRTGDARGDHPQNGLSQAQAELVCDSVAARLPTEAEWEYAAKGPVHRIYPWGDGPPVACTHAVTQAEGESGCGIWGTWPVGSKAAGASYVGAHDMIGNLWEWTQDCAHDSYDGAPLDGSAREPLCDGNRVARGGSLGDAPEHSRAAGRRGFWAAGERNVYLGARCARDAAEVQP